MTAHGNPIPDLLSEVKKDNVVEKNKIFNNLKCETLHINYCKSILGVQKKSSNFAVLCELGRFPLYYHFIKAMINYWFRLETLQNPSFILLKETYLVSKNVYLQNKPSWFTSIQAMLDQLYRFIKTFKVAFSVT
jgi:hypothetical protein